MPGNVTRDCVLITIKDDNEIEGMENFTVTATLVQSSIRTNMIIIAPNEARVLINDNDGMIITLLLISIIVKIYILCGGIPIDYV